MSGELPLLHVRISGQKIQSVVGLVQSVPLPSLGSTPSTPTEKVHPLTLKRVNKGLIVKGGTSQEELMSLFLVTLSPVGSTIG